MARFLPCEHSFADNGTDQAGGFGGSAERKIGQGLMGKPIGAMWKKLQEQTRPE